MKILICVHNLSNGGAEHVAVLWANGFKRCGNEVHVVTAEINARIDFNLLGGIILHSIYSGGNPLKRYFTKIWKLRKLLKSLKPDAAIAILQPWNYWLLLTTIGLKVPVINTEHNPFERPSSAPMPFKLRFDKFFLNRFFPAVTLLSTSDKEIYEKHNNNAFVLPNPLAYDSIGHEVNREKIILAVGRLNAWHVKGFDILIRAWGKIAEEYPEWTLCIVGNGEKEDVERINTFISDASVDGRVLLEGFRKDIIKLYQEAEIFVLSSRYEGFGLVLIEAMSQGCACIACDYKGRQKEIFGSEHAGLCCKPEDIDDLSTSLRKLLDDPLYRDEIRKAGIERSKYYNIENTMKRWDNIFKALRIKS